MKYATDEFLKQLEPFLESRLTVRIVLQNGSEIDYDTWDAMPNRRDEYKSVRVEGCGHSLTNTLGWCRTNQWDEAEIPELVKELASRDGYCDCTILVRLIMSRR